MTDQAVIDVAKANDADEVYAPSTDDIIDLMMSILSDRVDHPEVWRQVPAFLDHLPDLPTAISQRLNWESDEAARGALVLILIMCFAARGQVDFALENIEPLAIAYSQSAQVQGAVFYLHSLKDPENPKYNLEGKICPSPFIQLDVLERSSHLCCASWLQESAGDLSTTAWEDVWNSEKAQQIRASIHDGSYRYCNKMACPKIHANNLVPAEEMAAKSDLWRQIIEIGTTELSTGPEAVNLAYDRTCNLSCPS